MNRMGLFVVLILLTASVSPAVEDAARGGKPDRAAPETAKAFNATGLARVVATFASPVLRPAGLGWDGASFWVVSDYDQTIYKIDPATMTIMDSMPTPAADWSFGLDHDGTDLWGDVDSPELIYQLDDSTGGVLNSFASPYSAPNGVVFDGFHVWHSAYLSDLALMDPTSGTLIRTIPSPGNHVPRGLELYDGSLWVVDANGYVDDAIYRLDPSDGAVLGTYRPAGTGFGLIYGLVHDGSHFWLTDLDTAEFHQLELVEDLLFYDGFEGGDTGEWDAVDHRGGVCSIRGESEGRVSDR